MPNIREKARNSVIDSTATGIEAETVMPTFSTRYNDEAPKTIPNSAPSVTAGQVNSGIETLSGTCGRCTCGASASLPVRLRKWSLLGAAMRTKLAESSLRGPMPPRRLLPVLLFGFP